MKKILKKYKPIKIHHIKFGYGYWFGKRVYFIGISKFAIIPMFFICHDSIYASNLKVVGNGDSESWSRSRKKEESEKKRI